MGPAAGYNSDARRRDVRASRRLRVRTIGVVVRLYAAVEESQGPMAIQGIVTVFLRVRHGAGQEHQRDLPRLQSKLEPLARVRELRIMVPCFPVRADFDLPTFTVLSGFSARRTLKHLIGSHQLRRPCRKSERSRLSGERRGRA